MYTIKSCLKPNLCHTEMLTEAVCSVILVSLENLANKACGKFAKLKLFTPYSVPVNLQKMIGLDNTYFRDEKN